MRLMWMGLLLVPLAAFLGRSATPGEAPKVGYAPSRRTAPDVPILRPAGRRSAASLPSLDRNPFGFAPRPARQRKRAMVRPHAAAAPPPARNQPSWPTLIGIAEGTENGALLMTAVFADAAGAVLFASEGMALPGDFRVTAIAHDCVAVTHVPTGEARSVKLQ